MAVLAGAEFSPDTERRWDTPPAFLEGVALGAFGLTGGGLAALR